LVKGYYKDDFPDSHGLDKFDCKWLIYNPLPGTRSFASGIFWGEVRRHNNYSSEWVNGGDIRLSRNKKIELSMVVSRKYVRLATDAEIVLARMTGEIE